MRRTGGACTAYGGDLRTKNVCDMDMTGKEKLRP